MKNGRFAPNEECILVMYSSFFILHSSFLLFFVDGFETLNLVHVVLAEVAPFIIRIEVGWDRKRLFALVEESLHEDVARLAFLRTIEDELDVATHWEDVVVAPHFIEFA